MVFDNENDLSTLVFMAQQIDGKKKLETKLKKEAKEKETLRRLKAKYENTDSV